jgi:hypothetical protein
MNPRPRVRDDAFVAGANLLPPSSAIGGARITSMPRTMS